MALILAIEYDKRQAHHLTAMVRSRLHADLVLADSAEQALATLGDRVPDLVLTSALLSPKDEQALGERLRRLNGVAAHVQTLTLPMFAPPSQSRRSKGGVFSALLGGGDRHTAAAPDGCDPAMFAEQCREYLDRAAAMRHAHPAEDDTDHGPEEIHTAEEFTVELEADATAAPPSDTPADFLAQMMAAPSRDTTADRLAELFADADADADADAEPEPAEPAAPIAQPPVAEATPMAQSRPATRPQSRPATAARGTTPMSLIAALAAVDAADFEPSAADEAQVSAAEAGPAEELTLEDPLEPMFDEVPTDAPAELVDVDLSELLEEPEVTTQASSEEDGEVTVYELDAETAPIDDGPQPLSAAPAEDFDDWTRVVDALKRESARTRLPGVKAPATPRPAAAAAPGESLRDRRRKQVQDEWGVFDPEQAGMQALFDRLARLNDDDPPVRPA
jgi:hypothetical protein